METSFPGTSTQQRFEVNVAELATDGAPATLGAGRHRRRRRDSAAAGAAPWRTRCWPGRPGRRPGNCAPRCAARSLPPTRAAASRRRREAEKSARVELWDEPAGTKALAGRDLPPAEVLAADKRIAAIARELKNRGAAGTLELLRAKVYLALLAGQPLEHLLPARRHDSHRAPSAAGPGMSAATRAGDSEPVPARRARSQRQRASDSAPVRAAARAASDSAPRYRRSRDAHAGPPPQREAPHAHVGRHGRAASRIRAWRPGPAGSGGQPDRPPVHPAEPGRRTRRRRRVRPARR